MIESHGEASTSSLPNLEDPTMPKSSITQVSTLTKFLKSCVQMMKDRTALSILYNMIDDYKKGRDTSVT
jgi:hypothetical protein